MAKLAFIADVHVGNPSTFGGPVVCGVNTRGNQVLAALKAAVEAADGCDALVVCGDLFDISNPSPQLIADVQQILESAPRSLLLMGNHDMVSDTPGDHALGPLNPVSNVYIAEIAGNFPVEDSVILAVPFQVGAAHEWFADTVADLITNGRAAKKKRVLAFHLGIIDKDTPAFLREAHDAIPLEVVQEVMERHGISYAYCGNWHTPKRWGKIVQCGALAPTGWDNPGWDYGQVHILDTVTGHMSVTHIPGPRFLSVTTLDEAREAYIEGQRRGCDLYLNLKNAAAESLDEVRSWGVTARAVTDTTDVKEATRSAAVAVREAGTLREALAKYVTEMPVAEGVERSKVLAMAGKYLSQGGNA